MEAPKTIKTDSRIFKIITFDNDLILCNLENLKMQDLEDIKILHHFWNGNFTPFAKIDLKEMILINLKK
jgi:hypothetical protein